jgi:hypothetical protein
VKGPGVLHRGPCGGGGLRGRGFLEQHRLLGRWAAGQAGHALARVARLAFDAGWLLLLLAAVVSPSA